MKKSLWKRFVFVLAAAFAVAAGLDGCRPDPPVLPAEFTILVTSTPGTTFATDQAALLVAGNVLAFNAELPETIAWTQDAAKASGTAAIGTDGTFSINFTLTPGDNVITLSVEDAEQVLNVTYNEGFKIAGKLELTPDVAYVGELRQITARIALIDPDTNPAAVFLVQTSAAKQTQIAQLTDDGNLSNGDEIEGDGIYTGIFSVTESTEGFLTYRADIGLLSGGTAQSEEAEVLVKTRPAAQDLFGFSSQLGAFEQQLADASQQGHEEVQATVDGIVAELQADPKVAQAGETQSGTGAWVIYKNGVAGLAYAPDDEIKSGGSVNPDRVSGPVDPHNTSMAVAGYDNYYPDADAAKQAENNIKSNKSFAMMAQYFDWGENDDVPKMDDLLFNAGCFEQSNRAYGSKGSGSVEDFKGLGNFGTVLISSHGDTAFQNADALYTATFRWNGAGGQVALHSNMAITETNIQTYLDDLVQGRLVLWGSHYGIMPSFITEYTGAMPNSFVYMSICRGAFNGTMAQAFLNSGAGAFIGFTEYVSVSFCVATGPTVLTEMLKPDMTVGDGFDLVKNTSDPSKPASALTPAKPVLFGAASLQYDLEGLQDPSFESGSVSQSWSVDGDARVIPQLGGAAPTDGTYMAIISTGLGFTTATGTLRQEFCMPENAGFISFDWNFFSEEFMEYVGSQFQDSITVTLTEADNPANTVTLMNEFVDSLAGAVSPVAIGFDQGDVYATGWMSTNEPIPGSMNGKRVILEFFTTDIGDSIYDTAVLIDNIELQTVK